MESDLGPVIGGMPPMKMIEKPYRFDEGGCVLQRAAGFVFLLVLGFLACVFTVLIGVVVAHAHGPAEWIQRGNYHNAAGELCCGERDCGEMISGKVATTPSGYRVDAKFRITAPDGTVTIDDVHELVPYSEATPSPDGAYWRCRWGGERKCFFAPPGST